MNEKHVIIALSAVVVALVVLAVSLARRRPDQVYLDRLHALDLSHSKLSAEFRTLELLWEEFYDKIRRLSSRIDKERGLALKKNSDFAPEPGADAPDENQMTLPDEMLLKPAAPLPAAPDAGSRLDLLARITGRK